MTIFSIPRMPFMGVRNSCDMFARNSLLALAGRECLLHGDFELLRALADTFLQQSLAASRVRPACSPSASII